MRNWRKWREQRTLRSDRGRRAATARWDAVHADRAAEPVRDSRVVEITIRDSTRPLRQIQMQCEPTEHGWSRWAVTENGHPAGRRRFGATAIARLIAQSLQ